MQDYDRLLYLKQCLKGPPLDLIDRYAIDDLGYQYATAALEKRYFNPQQALAALRKDLHDLRAQASTYADILRFEQDLVHICGNFRQAGEDITDNTAHQPVALAGLVTSKRWARQQGIRGVKLMENLLARVKLLKVRSLAQMVLIKYIDRLRSNDVDRTPAALEFLNEVLTARNLRRELPELLKRYQPQITDDDTNDPWPTRKDLRHALDNWSCYCVHAAIYVMEHLSGPIVYEPDWLTIEDISQESFQSIVIDMIDDHAGVLNALRHQMYRQYVHAFMEAIKVGLEEFSYERFDDDKKKRMPLGTLTALPTVLFADQYILDTFGPGLRDDVQPILIDMANRDSVIEQVLHYFPHSTTTRVVFWFSSDYTRAGKKGLRYILAALSDHYTTHLGRIEQFVVLPTYVRHKREIWTREVLNAYFQRKTVMPFARVALGPLDLRLWERDDRELRAGGDLKDWDSYGVNGIDEDGHYVLEELIGATKVYMRQHHDLDLWINEETTSSRTSPSTLETSTSDRHHTSSASGSRPTTTSAILQAPSTSGQRAHSVPGVDLEAIAANMAKKLPNKGTTPEEQAVIASALEYISSSGLAQATSNVLQEAQPRLDDIEQQITRSQRTPKKSKPPRMSLQGPRKDKDHEPRK